MKKYIVAICCALVFYPFISCEKDYIQEDKKDTTEKEQSETENTGVNEDEDDYTWDSTGAVHIILNNNSINADTAGVTVSGSIVTITSAGIYNIEGSLTNGQIIVNTEDKEDVKLILNNVNITCSTSAPLYISSAKKVIIKLEDNTENYLTDGTSYQDLVDEEPNAALFSKSDLTIFGNGSLTVDGNYNDGISSKDGLIIKSGTISISSADDGIRGKDYCIIYDGNITINAGGDGLKSDITDNTSLGYISIYNGIFNITSGGDAITAQTNIEIADGEFNIVSGGGSTKSISAILSAKGIKGLTNIVIAGGTFSISSADDALHSDADIDIKGGIFDLSSGDDGIHADASITIKNTDINITKSYEGIESALITIDSSNVGLIASDDGFNATMGSRTEQNDNSCLTINSGFIYVNASGGDALDANGNIVINGGTIVAHGPSSDPEVGMDYNGTCKISGGKIVISGTNSNMTQAPSTSSTQYSVLVRFSSTQSANSIVHIQDDNGNNIVTFAPVRAYYSIIVSSPDLSSGGTYTIYTGGSCTGTVTNGLYNGGTYSGGTIYDSFTISSKITTVGTSFGGSGGHGRPGG